MFTLVAALVLAAGAAAVAPSASAQVAFRGTFPLPHGVISVGVGNPYYYGGSGYYGSGYAYASPDYCDPGYTTYYTPSYYPGYYPRYYVRPYYRGHRYVRSYRPYRSYGNRSYGSRHYSTRYHRW
jgi:hypothetical protein